jgi:TRAP-type C4-dicarboxylate transport system substrate-binding protein
MPTITLTDKQIVDLIQQLPPEQKRTVLLTLASDAQTRRAAHGRYAEDQLRQRAAERGFDWDELTEDEREAFVDELLHEEP